MHPRPHHRGTAGLALAWLAVVLLAGCSGSGGSPSAAAPPATTALGPRPASTAKLTILTPHNGQTIHNQTPEVRLGLQGAKIVTQTSTHIRPDQGHVHLLVDGKLVAMNYRLNERLPTLRGPRTTRLIPGGLRGGG
jgi:hypothetical protein